jgi:acetyl-CoA carboxylase carboxyl transferase subunit alpha
MSSPIDDFEQPIADLEAQIERVRRLTREQGMDREPEIARLEEQAQRLLGEVYANLSGWDKTRVARNPKRPFTLDFIRLLLQDFTELHGDRVFGDDGAMIGGVGRLGDQWITVIGQQKGRDAQERHKRNFGMARPEGYRKAQRLLKLAEKFKRPVLCLIDTPAADCTVPSEERGISEAIARTMQDMFLLRVPVIVVIIGEGGSGGAIGIGVGDRVLMLEHAIYSVIPPEGCAAIIWKTAERGPEAADALRLTAQDALAFGVVDEIIPEPLGAAHRDYDATARALREAVERHLAESAAMTAEERLAARYARFRRLGDYLDLSAAQAE